MTVEFREAPVPTIHASPNAAMLKRRTVRGLVIGLVASVALSVLGAMGTGASSVPVRLAYWLAVIMPGSLLGLFFAFAVESWGRLQGKIWAEIMLVSVLVALPHTFIVVVASTAMFEIDRINVATILSFGMVVLFMSLILTTINYTTASASQPTTPAPPLIPALLPLQVEPQMIAASVELPPATVPDGFADKLPLRLRAGRLLALEAEDHYLRVHTDIGSDLLLMRMADGVALLESTPGARVHRSWWVARDAVESAASIGGNRMLRLAGGLEVPVSRSMRSSLMAEGWFDGDV